jgi:hypothetical protein
MAASDTVAPLWANRSMTMAVAGAGRSRVRANAPGGPCEPSSEAVGCTSPLPGAVCPPSGGAAVVEGVPALAAAARRVVEVDAPAARPATVDDVVGGVDPPLDPDTVVVDGDGPVATEP